MTANSVKEKKNTSRVEPSLPWRPRNILTIWIPMHNYTVIPRWRIQLLECDLSPYCCYKRRISKL